MANGGVYDGSGPRGGSKNRIGGSGVYDGTGPRGGNKNLIARPKPRRIRATADVRGLYSDLPPAHQLALHILTNGQYGIGPYSPRRKTPMRVASPPSSGVGPRY